MCAFRARGEPHTQDGCPRSSPGSQWGTAIAAVPASAFPAGRGRKPPPLPRRAFHTRQRAQNSAGPRLVCGAQGPCTGVTDPGMHFSNSGSAPNSCPHPEKLHLATTTQNPAAPHRAAPVRNRLAYFLRSRPGSGTVIPARRAPQGSRSQRGVGLSLLPTSCSVFYSCFTMCDPQAPPHPEGNKVAVSKPSPRATTRAKTHGAQTRRPTAHA